MKTTLRASFLILTALSVSAVAAEAPRSEAVVRVTGAVANPGVYSLASAASLYAALRLAGGTTPDADLSCVKIIRHREGQSAARVVEAVWMRPALARRAAKVSDPRDVALEASDEVFVPKASSAPRNVVTRYFRDVPFAEAVDSILKDTSYGYSIDPAIAQQNLKVTASIKSSPVESALRNIAQAAGAQCRIEDNNVVIKQLPSLTYAQQNTLGASYNPQYRSGMAANDSAASYLSSAAPPEPTQTATIELRHIEPGAVLPLVSNIQGVQTARSLGKNQLMLTGRRDAIIEAERAVTQMDTADAYARPVRIRIEILLSKADKSYTCSTEEIGAEGSTIPVGLDVSAVSSPEGPVGSIRMQGFVVPSILKSPVDGNDLSLSGQCRVYGTVFGMQFDKSFGFAASLKSGLDSEPQTIASGSLSNSQEDFGFRVTAKAAIEKGRLAQQTGRTPEAASAPPEALVQSRELTAKGKELLARGVLDEAVGHFEKAVQLDPNNSDAQHGLGKALAKQGKLDAAIVHLNKALTLDPSRLDYQEDLDETIRLRGVPLGPSESK